MKKKIILGIILAGTVSLTQAQKKKIVKTASIATSNKTADNNLTGSSIVTVNVTELKNKNGRFFLRSGHINDSAKIVDNKLVFKNELNEPQVAYVMFYPATNVNDQDAQSRAQRKNIFPFYLTPGSTAIIVKDSIAGSHITSPNPFQKDYENITGRQRQFEETKMLPLIQQFYAARGQGNRDASDKIAKQLDSLNNQEKETIFKPFIQEKGATSPVALSIIAQTVQSNEDLPKAEPLFALINPAYQSLPTGIALKTALEQEKVRAQQNKATEVGQPAIDFTQNDTLGHPISLKDFRGKYVLVDFWASWCGPCRGENPNVVAAFNKYKDKNFTILGVSFDQNKDRWMAAIHDDGLKWNHVSDLKYWNNAVGQLYCIQSIPANILVDPNGNIIAKNIRGEELQETLAKIFGK